MISSDQANSGCFAPPPPLRSHVFHCTRFPHDTQTTSWLTSRLPSANVSAINACDNLALQGCLVDADLLVIGQADDAATNVTAVMAAVEDFARRSKPVLYLHYYYIPTPLSTALFTRVLGLSSSFGDNYWARAGLVNQTRDIADAIRGETLLPGLKRAADCTFDLTNSTGMNLDLEDFMPCYRPGGQSWTVECNREPFNTKIRRPLISLRDKLNSFDDGGQDLFPLNVDADASLPVHLKIAVLLGDKARERVAYPFNRTDRFALATSMFGDASVLYRRRYGPAQLDVGSLTCPERYMMDMSLPRPDTCLALGYGT